MTLYEINRQIEQLLADAFSLDEETGEVTENAAALIELEKLSIAKDDKIEAIACYIKDLDAMAEAIRAEHIAMAARYKRYADKAAKVREYLQAALDNEEIAKFESAKVKITFRTSETTQIEDLWMIPKEYIREKQTVTRDADKMAIKKAIKAGIEVPGAYIEQRRTMKIV